MKLYKKFSLLLLAIMMAATFALGGVAHADPFDSATEEACKGAAVDANQKCDDTAATSLSNVLASVLNVLSLIVGVVAVIMIIIGGLRYVTSAGDSGRVSSAKNTIVYAIVGLIVVAFSQFIVRFVLNTATQQ